MHTCWSGAVAADEWFSKRGNMGGSSVCFVVSRLHCTSPPAFCLRPSCLHPPNASQAHDPPPDAMPPSSRDSRALVSKLQTCERRIETLEKQLGEEKNKRQQAESRARAAKGRADTLKARLECAEQRASDAEKKRKAELPAMKTASSGSKRAREDDEDNEVIETCLPDLERTVILMPFVAFSRHGVSIVQPCTRVPDKMLRTLLVPREQFEYVMAPQQQQQQQFVLSHQQPTQQVVLAAPHQQPQQVVLAAPHQQPQQVVLAAPHPLMVAPSHQMMVVSTRSPASFVRCPAGFSF